MKLSLAVLNRLELLVRAEHEVVAGSFAIELELSDC